MKIACALARTRGLCVRNAPERVRLVRIQNPDEPHGCNLE